ncbi:MAG: aldo/keto reductase [Anaerolineales bacterium]|nr:aldo/keto reductase [Anaerolineales bacterium]
METRTLGKTNLPVSRLGLGLSELGYELTLADEARAAQVLNQALDAGINFLDTSACYNISEELIGRTIAHRRDDYVLATKCGHVAGGYRGRDWTAQTITDSIERSLKRLKTDRLDLVQLHSCGVDVLEKGEAIEALLAAQKAGKTRFVGYSGDNEAALWAVHSGLFDTLQTSFNLVDQAARRELFPAAQAQGMGVIVKRPIANAAWGAERSPSGYANDYFRRAQAMLAAGPLPGAPDDHILLALGFALAHAAVDTVIVGTQNPRHLAANIALVESALPLASEVVAALHGRFDQTEREWRQLR